MNHSAHSVCDIAVGMILGYALARGFSHLHEESPLSDGADSMADHRARCRAGTTLDDGPGSVTQPAR